MACVFQNRLATPAGQADKEVARTSATCLADCDRMYLLHMRPRGSSASPPQRLHPQLERPPATGWDDDCQPVEDAIESGFAYSPTSVKFWED